MTSALLNDQTAETIPISDERPRDLLRGAALRGDGRIRSGDLLASAVDLEEIGVLRALAAGLHDAATLSDLREALDEFEPPAKRNGLPREVEIGFVGAAESVGEYLAGPGRGRPDAGRSPLRAAGGTCRAGVVPRRTP